MYFIHMQGKVRFFYSSPFFVPGLSSRQVRTVCAVDISQYTHLCRAQLTGEPQTLALNSNHWQPVFAQGFLGQDSKSFMSPKFVSSEV